MKVAIVHDWLVNYAGAERVLEQIVNMFPEADIFSIVDFLPEKERDLLNGHRVTTSFIQKLPGARKHYRSYLLLMPLAIEQFDLSAYDLVISSSYAVAKGVITGPDQLHISYVHSPIRYAWDLQHQYLHEAGLERGLKGWLAKWILHKIRLWDSRTANGVDHFVANSHFIARRIWKVYRRESEVIYPPVDVTYFSLHDNKEDFYLTASRMVPYKKISLIVEAFTSMPDKQLVVIGDGPEMVKIKAKAGDNIKIMGHQPSNILRDYMQRAKAFVFAPEEDFGITPVEAQACGTPVIAFGKGGSMETVLALGSVKEPTGLFFDKQSIASLTNAIQKFEANLTEFSAEACHNNALQFAADVFTFKFKDFVINKYKQFELKR